MRIANLKGRAVLVAGDQALDVEQASEGRFEADPQSVWKDWPAFSSWGASVDPAGHARSASFDRADLGAPVPRPSQVFGIGLNYADHAREAQLEVPEHPLVFTKFPSSLSGPAATVRLSSDRVDWEAELVVVIGSGGRDIAESNGWDAVAGLTVGQDLSDRTVQNWGKPAQFNLGKSFQGYAPTGPAVVTLDEVRAAADPDALSISCRIADDEDSELRTLQDGTTGDLIFTVPRLVAELSAIVELFPGDLVFTGTPAGVGMGRNPQVFLKPGQRLVTEIEAIGTVEQRFVL